LLRLEIGFALKAGIYRHTWNVRFGSWLCKNALAEALMPGDPGAVAVCSDFLEFAIFPFWERS